MLLLVADCACHCTCLQEIVDSAEAMNPQNEEETSPWCVSLCLPSL